jgi:stress response protein YsnF
MTGTPPSSSEHPSAVGPGEAPGPVEVVRSEERLQVGRAVRVSGRAVLRKYVVTETVTQTFEVRHEEVRLDLEPATGADEPAPADGAFDDRVVEVVLHREVPVVQLKVEATERVRLHVDTVTEQVPVSADLRAERVEVDSPDA